MSIKWNDHFNVRAEQFKPAYNREELTSSTSLQFIDRSILNETVTHGYDLGVMFHGNFFDKKLEYAAYATNENNNRNNFNFNNELLFGGRLIYNILGQHGYTMSDVTNSEEHQLAVGAARSLNKPIAAGEDTIIASSADVAWRYNGWSFLGEGDFIKNSTDDLETLGFLGQAGYFIVPEKFEVANGVIPLDVGVTNGYKFGGSLNISSKGITSSSRQIMACCSTVRSF